MADSVFKRPPRGMIFAQARPPLPESLSTYKTGFERFLAGDRPGAIELFKQAQQQDPMNLDAVRGLERLSPQLPSSPVSDESLSLYKQGLDAYQNGNSGLAEQLWGASFEADPGNIDARRGLERLAGKRGQTIISDQTFRPF